MPPALAAASGSLLSSQALTWPCTSTGACPVLVTVKAVICWPGLMSSRSGLIAMLAACDVAANPASSISKSPRQARGRACMFMGGLRR